MQTPLEIVFHNLPSSEWIEITIRQRVAKIEKLFPRLVSCRISVEALHKQHRTGSLYEVHIELFLPGNELVVSREPHRAKEKYASPTLKTALRDAFEAAERQLVEYKRQRSGEVKTHDVLFQGQISQLHPGGEHGFILTAEGTQLYFHRNSLLEGAFEKLKRGDVVHYVPADGDTGPVAKKVWVGPDFHMD